MALKLKFGSKLKPKLELKLKPALLPHWGQSLDTRATAASSIEYSVQSVVALTSRKRPRDMTLMVSQIAIDPHSIF